MEVVDPNPDAADRLHVVSIAGSAQFCKERQGLRGDYFRKMLRGEQDEHKGWMLRTTVSGRWIRHIATGEHVAVVGKVKEFIKKVARNRPAGDMPFKDDGDALAKLLAGTFTSHGNLSNILDKWEKVPEPYDVISRFNTSTSIPDSASTLPDFAAAAAAPPPSWATSLGAQWHAPLRPATTQAAAAAAAGGDILAPAALGHAPPTQVRSPSA
mgnify:CR=1 FL=1